VPLAEANTEQNMITAFFPRKKMEINGDFDKTLETRALSGKTRRVRTNSLLSLAGCSPAILIVSHFPRTLGETS